MAQSGHPDRLDPCPLLGVKRTSTKPHEMSAYDPSATSAARAATWLEVRPRPHSGPKAAIFTPARGPAPRWRRPRKRCCRPRQSAAVRAAVPSDVQFRAATACGLQGRPVLPGPCTTPRIRRSRYRLPGGGSRASRPITGRPAPRALAWRRAARPQSPASRQQRRGTARFGTWVRPEGRQPANPTCRLQPGRRASPRV